MSSTAIAWSVVILIVVSLIAVIIVRRSTLADPIETILPSALISPVIPIVPSSPPREEAVFCPQIYDPVCGTDGKTYSNACVAEQQNGVPVAHPGECQ